jgi:hypothetical protein
MRLGRTDSGESEFRIRTSVVLVGVSFAFEPSGRLFSFPPPARFRAIRILLNAASPDVFGLLVILPNCVASVPWACLDRVGDDHPLRQKAFGSLGFVVADRSG